tara:strand:+ start:2055 stop:2579 length:525 start_codon:yes stop_codon:yes gene_type:complete
MMGGLIKSNKPDPQPKPVARKDHGSAYNELAFYSAKSGAFRKADLPQEVYAAQNVHARQRLDRGGVIPLNPSYYAAKQNYSVSRKTDAPKPAPVRTITRQQPQEVIYRRVPVQGSAAPAKPKEPEYRKSASGRYVMAGGKQSKAGPKLGRGRRSTIVTGDLGEGPQIKKPKLGD